ncbi:MAG: hypothetical protein ACTSUN_01495 [Promethearchaeota archaeon]
MSHQNRVFDKLKRGYTPTEFGKPAITSIYNEVFKPLVKRRELELFMNLYATNENVLKAWSFLGIYQILKEDPRVKEDLKPRIQEIIKQLLMDESLIIYHGGNTKIEKPLREHHVGRICELDWDLTFPPVFEYVSHSIEKKVDDVTGELLEKVLSKTGDPRIEDLIFQLAHKINAHDIKFKSHIIKALMNLQETTGINDKEQVKKILHSYLEDINAIKESIQSASDTLEQSLMTTQLNKYRLLHEKILRAAAILDLDFERETLKYLENLKYPFPSLPEIAEKYKNKEKFKEILLEKLEITSNPNLIKDLLLSILALKNIIPNWRDLVMNNLENYHLNDSELIVKLEEENFYDEDILTAFLKEGEEWQLEFIRELLLYFPEKLDEWKKFREQFVLILNSLPSPEQDLREKQELLKKKEIIFKILIELGKKNMIKPCLENFKNLKDEHLRKMCLFIMMKFGEQPLLLDLKTFLKTDNEANVIFKKFWKELERRDGQFYY